jgi:hypothetical protein
MPNLRRLCNQTTTLPRCRRHAALSAACGLMLAVAGNLQAHDDAYLDTLTGPNGGTLRVVGNHHLELVVDPPADSPSSEQPVLVYLSDHADQPTDSTGFSARAVIVANRERVNVSLEPDGGNRLSGNAVFGQDPDMVVVVTLTTPEQSSEQARFTPYKHLDGSLRSESKANAPMQEHHHHH